MKLRFRGEKPAKQAQEEKIHQARACAAVLAMVEEYDDEASRSLMQSTALEHAMLAKFYGAAAEAWQHIFGIFSPRIA